MGEAGEVIHKAVASGKETAIANPQTSSEGVRGYSLTPQAEANPQPEEEGGPGRPAASCTEQDERECGGKEKEQHGH